MTGDNKTANQPTCYEWKGYPFYEYIPSQLENSLCRLSCTLVCKGVVINYEVGGFNVLEGVGGSFGVILTWELDVLAILKGCAKVSNL